MIYVCLYNPCQQTDSCLINTAGIYQVGTRLQMTRQDGLMYINSIYKTKSALLLINTNFSVKKKNKTTKPDSILKLKSFFFVLSIRLLNNCM